MTLIEAITAQKRLKPAEEGLQKRLHGAFQAGGASGQKVKNALHGTWIGHPLHVILTDIPLGAWTSAMLFDAIASITDSKALNAAADASIAAGLAGAIAAAAAGLTDWQ